MGYRSQVEILVYGAKDDLQRYYDSYFTENAINDLELDKSSFILKSYENDKMYFKYTGDYVKWYDDYKGVMFFTKFYQDAESHNLNAEYLRIGEEYGDIEQYQSGNCVEYYLNPIITIECNLD